MARWPSGEQTVAFLLDRGRLERIDAQNLAAMADTLLDRARRRVATASAALDLSDVDGAYAAAYDAYRMAAESLLVRQGLRAAGGEGSHMTVEDAISAQFGSDIVAFTKPTFERMRRTRHTAQYFDPSAAPITDGDARWAIEKATAATTDVRSLSASTPPGRFE
jgi:HEPN domain